MGKNALIALELLVSLTKAATELSEALQRARAENRDISDDELAALRARREAAFSKVFGA